MPTTIRTAVLRGVEAVPIDLEVSCDPRDVPGVFVTGALGAVPTEVASTLRCAMRSSGLAMPRGRVTLALSPMGATRWQDCLMLAAAVGILAESGQMPDAVRDAHGLPWTLVTGAVDMSGNVRPTRGTVAFDLLARDAPNVARELRAPDPTAGGEPVWVRCVRTLGELCATDEGVDPALARPAGDGVSELGTIVHTDAGKEGRAALAEACARSYAMSLELDCRHGKGMMDVRRNWSVAGRPVPSGVPVVHASPHLSMAGLFGGGRPVHPGVVTLADHGVLVLDHLELCSRALVDGLAQAMRDREVRLVRADGTYAMPADFVLVACVPCTDDEGPRIEEATPERLASVWRRLGEATRWKEPA